MASAICPGGDVCASCAGNVEFAFIKTHRSLGFRWNA
jgi:hypothetical protein